MNISLDRSASFRVRIFSCYLDNFGENLKVNDVISVSYSEMGLAFSSVGYQETLKQLAGFAIREESNKLFNLTGNSNGMYRIENFDMASNGGFLEWSKPYKLKHLG